MEGERAQAQTLEFQAEVSQLLDIVTHSLYTHRDIFIRELISNAADALDKVRFKELKGGEIEDKNLDLEIHIDLDKGKRTLTISDTGIGMTREELINNIGTIARSGTAEFVKQLVKEDSQNIGLIGKFGIGFYSVFMAGEKVEITTKSAEIGEPALIWRSDGKNSYEIEQAESPVTRGTHIKVFLRNDAEEFAEDYRVKSIVEKYSNFVPFPIYLGKEKVNKISAIWRNPKSSVKKEEYIEFFKFIAKETDEPTTWLHFSADAPIQFHSLLFIPKSNVELMGFGREDDGIHLFVKRIMVDAHAKEILPDYLRFVRGVLESDDLPLNISRETLQENPYMFKIKNTVVTRLVSHLVELGEKEPDQYNTIWKQHGRIIKEGYADFANKEKVADLFRFNSSRCKSADETVSLKTYCERMAEKQEEIYFLSGPSREAIDKNPNLEIFKSKDIEVFYCYDPIDEFCLPGLVEYKGKRILSADQVELKKLADVPTKTESKKEPKKDTKELKNLARRIKDILGDKVEDVIISERLVDSPAILVGKDRTMSSHMEKIMQMYNQEIKLTPKIMEINRTHPMILNLLDIYGKDPKDAMLSKMVFSLFDSLMLLDGSIDDPNRMAVQIQDVLGEAAQLYLKTRSKDE
jgi:molecular chaperone HtpG